MSFLRGGKGSTRGRDQDAVYKQGKKKGYGEKDPFLKKGDGYMVEKGSIRQEGEGKNSCISYRRETLPGKLRASLSVKK